MVNQEQVLDSALPQLGLEGATEAQRAQWLKHLALLLKWNRTYNLTAIKDPGQVMVQHLLDSLSVHYFVKHRHILDVGTGGGFPGLPLAVLHPEKRFTLIDASNKKVRFVKQVAMELGLTNVTAIHGRIETQRLETAQNQVISRAFSSIFDFVTLTSPHIAADGEWLAMKGKNPAEELAELPPDFTYNVCELSVPGLNAERHLVTIRREK